RLGSRRVSRYRFRHIVFQNYLYNSLDLVERAHLHEEVGTVLEALHADDTQEIALSLARHFQEAGITNKAIEYLYQAGIRAVRMSANQEAVAHFTRSLELLNSVPKTTDCLQRELDLQVALGVPLVLTRGHAAREVEQTYARARELSAQIGGTPQLFHVLLGLRRYYLHCGRLQTARELGEELITLAERSRDASQEEGALQLSRAHAMHAEILYCLGEFVQAREHAQQGVRLFAPQRRRDHVLLYGNDTSVISGIHEALALWHLGHPNHALEIARDMLDRSRELAHAFTLTVALFFTAMLYQLRRDIKNVQALSNELLRIADEQGFALYLAWGTVLLGWALGEEEREEEGISHMRKGIDGLDAIGVIRMQPYYRALLAQAYARVGRAHDGMDLLSKALALAEQTGECTFEAEIYRLQGELVKRQLDDAVGKI
ncbi:MAG: hypothetical protein GTN93_27905, partial [Anaerolineae bacterium]|nr:hypothetical protein [Anaerolineae bacterium]